MPTLEVAGFETHPWLMFLRNKTIEGGDFGHIGSTHVVWLVVSIFFKQIKPNDCGEDLFGTVVSELEQKSGRDPKVRDIIPG